MLEQERYARYEEALLLAQQRVAAWIDRHPDVLPVYTQGGAWQPSHAPPANWSDGFLAGMMWQFFRHTGQHRWQEAAEHCARLVEPLQHETSSYDLGMIFLHSHLPWYELQGDRRVRGVLFTAGTTLAQRFHHRGRFFSSGAARDSLSITMMMNVPLIQFVANAKLDQDLARFVIAHTRTTRDQLVRQDGSAAQAVRFDSDQGRFADQHSTLGLNDASVWARGLAWSIYGFTKTFVLTHAPEFLRVAQRNAEYWLTHLPADRVPLWDFAATEAAQSQAAQSQAVQSQAVQSPSGVQRDSSAAAIAASALLELAAIDPAHEHAIAYRTTALAMIDALLGPEYLAADTPQWDGLLQHGVYDYNRRIGVDESLICGDYFLVEAITKVLATVPA